MIDSPTAYITTVATRLAIDHLRSARVRREQYMGDWLPEPLVESPEGDPAQRAEMLDSLSFAFLAVLERLPPEQRAVLLLRDVFGYGYDEIAEILDMNSGERPPARRPCASPGPRCAPTFRSVTRQRDRLGVELLRGGRARRPPGARGRPRRGRRAAGRRRRQGSGPRPLDRRTRRRRAGADGLGSHGERFGGSLHA